MSGLCKTKISARAAPARLRGETLRQWLLQADLWRSRQQRQAAVHQPHFRRVCLGKLIQIDGSDHHWFEDRGPACTLLVYIDVEVQVPGARSQ